MVVTLPIQAQRRRAKRWSIALVPVFIGLILLGGTMPLSRFDVVMIQGVPQPSGAIDWTRITDAASVPEGATFVLVNVERKPVVPFLPAFVREVAWFDSTVTMLLVGQRASVEAAILASPEAYGFHPRSRFDGSSVVYLDARGVAASLLILFCAVAYVMVIVWGVRWMRARNRHGRGLCFACGYQIEGAPRCPECGTEAERTA